MWISAINKAGVVTYLNKPLIHFDRTEIDQSLRAGNALGRHGQGYNGGQEVWNIY